MKSKNGLPVIDRQKELNSVDQTVALDEIITETRQHLRESVELSFGRKLKVTSHEGLGDQITLSDPGGKVELQILITARGPVLRFETADLQISSKGKIRFQCEDFEVHAHHEIKQTSEGDFRQQVSGNAHVDVKGDLDAEARTCSLSASRGNINLNANDDIKMKSERILLNC